MQFEVWEHNGGGDSIIASFDNRCDANAYARDMERANWADMETLGLPESYFSVLAVCV